MALDDAVEAARQHHAEIAARLGPEERAQFAGFWAALLEAAGDAPAQENLRWDIKHELVEFLAERLPPEHPVRRALRDDDLSFQSTSTAERRFDPDALQALLDDLRGFAPEPTLAQQAHEELLAHPTLSARRVRELGADPADRRLIRLRDTTGEIRLPAFQFGADGQPLPVVLTINEMFDAAGDPWAVASWWLDPNSWLAEAPAVLLGHIAESDLIAVARADFEVC